MSFTPEQILGPLGLLVFLLIAVYALARDHRRNDDTQMARSAKLEAQLDLALAGWREQTDASAKSAAAIEEVARLLRTDPSRQRRVTK